MFNSPDVISSDGTEGPWTTGKKDNVEANKFLDYEYLNPKTGSMRRKLQYKKDCSPEVFWTVYEDIKAFTKSKALNPTWGPKKLMKAVSYHPNPCTERQGKHWIAQYYYNIETDEVYWCNYQHRHLYQHRVCLPNRDRTVLEVKKEHEKDHRGPDCVYETLRKLFFPVNRDLVRNIFRDEIDYQYVGKDVRKV